MQKFPANNRLTSFYGKINDVTDLSEIYFVDCLLVVISDEWCNCDTWQPLFKGQSLWRHSQWKFSEHNT